MRDNETRSRPIARRLRRELTSAETILWSQLRRDMFFGLRFRRQHPIGPYIADFACTAAQLVIEIDGGTHSTPAEQSHDRRRDAYLRKHGWRVIRVTNTDVYRKLDSVLDYIAVSVEAVRKLPPPSVAASSDCGCAAIGGMQKIARKARWARRRTPPP